MVSYKLYGTVVDDDECAFCPVELLQLQFSPEKLRVGETATLLDGLCNRSDVDVNTQMYLGAQSLRGTLTVSTVDLLTKKNDKGETVAVTDTNEGRLPRVLEPGCIVTAPIIAPLPTTFTPGMWIVRVHIVVTGPGGRVQHINKTSNPFEVIQ